MALKDLVARLKSQGAVTAVTSEKLQPLQKNPNVFNGVTAVTAVTAVFVDTPSKNRVEATGEAANDPAPEPPTHPKDWNELADAYNRHHFKCAVCIAAGKGYGLRCGVGAALWRAYAEYMPGTPAPLDKT